MPSNTLTAQVRRKIKGHLAYIESFHSVDGRTTSIFERTDCRGNVKRFTVAQKAYAIEEHLQGVVTGISKIYEKSKI